MREGRDVVRIFDKSSLKWTTLPGVKLSEYRWYPTQVRRGHGARRQGPLWPCLWQARVGGP
jgi:hypothetical protein